MAKEEQTQRGKGIFLPPELKVTVLSETDVVRTSGSIPDKEDVEELDRPKEVCMGLSYNKLWKLLVDKKMSKAE